MGKHISPPAPEENVVINVVPLVDIMFLLLLFLMIGGDMSHREAAELTLPQADKAVEQKTDLAPDDRYCVINIHAIKDPTSLADREAPWFRAPENWQFSIGGVPYKTYWELLDGTPTATGLKAIAETKREDVPVAGTSPPKYLSAVFVTIRADKDSPYGMIQLAMQACAEATLYKIEVGAAKPAK